MSTLEPILALFVWLQVTHWHWIISASQTTDHTRPNLLMSSCIYFVQQQVGQQQGCRLSQVNYKHKHKRRKVWRSAPDSVMC